MALAWTLLFLNTLTFVPGVSALPLPSFVGKGLTQGALPLAILVALSVNPKLAVRPNLFLCLVSLLVLDALIGGTMPKHVGTVYRTFRLAEFVGALWLLTPWWGRRDMLLLRCHLRCLLVALGSVLAGILVSPGKAFAYEGRLTGAIWPMFPTQIAHFSALVVGVALILWLSHVLQGRWALAGIGIGVVILVLTHTRTAMLSLLAGVLVAGLSVFSVNARVRRFFAAAVVVVSVGVVTVAGFVTTWLARGQSSESLVSLTGRTDFWLLVINQPRTSFQEIFGFGMSNASVNGLPIDSNWLASYMMLGLFGVVVCVMMIACLYVATAFQPRGTSRALALFVITYCLVTSFTEVGFTDASTYLLDLAVVASLLGVPRRSEQMPLVPTVKD